MRTTQYSYGDWPREGPGLRGAYLLYCQKCGAVDKFKAGAKYPITKGTVEHIFATRGWVVEGTGVGVCRGCQSRRLLFKEANEMTPDKKVLHMVAAPEIPPTVEPQPSPAVIRKPTREQNRVIHEMIEEFYDDKKLRYKGNHSDAAIAAKLSCPRKWVSDVREMLFGPDDVNEQSMQQVAELTEIKAEVLKVEATIEGCLTQLQALNNRVKDVETKMRQ